MLGSSKLLNCVKEWNTILGLSIDYELKICMLDIL